MHNAVTSCLILAIAVAACGGGGDGPTPPPPTPVFTSLSVSPANPAMVEGDTLQLSATPRDQNGAAMSGLPGATFSRTAGTSVTVSGDGRVIAVDPGGSTVTATLTVGGNDAHRYVDAERQRAHHGGGCGRQRCGHQLQPGNREDCRRRHRDVELHLGGERSA